MHCTRDLPPDASAPGSARRFIEEAIADPGLRQDAVLIASELVANAYLHADPPMTIAVEDLDSGAGAVRISVSNQQRPSAPSVPRVEPELSASAHRGRGLQLVAQLASDWGWYVDDDRLTVWAVIGAP